MEESSSWVSTGLCVDWRRCARCHAGLNSSTYCVPNSHWWNPSISTVDKHGYPLYFASKDLPPHEGRIQFSAQNALLSASTKPADRTRADAKRRREQTGRPDPGPAGVPFDGLPRLAGYGKRAAELEKTMVE